MPSYPGDDDLRFEMMDLISSVVVGARNIVGYIWAAFMNEVGLGVECGSFEMRFGPMLIKYLLNSSAIDFLSVIVESLIENSDWILEMGL
jgi:hypothetical protein